MGSKYLYQFIFCLQIGSIYHIITRVLLLGTWEKFFYGIDKQPGCLNIKRTHHTQQNKVDYRLLARNMQRLSQTEGGKHRLRAIVLHFSVSPTLCFLRTEGLWQPSIVYWGHFSNSVGSLYVSVLHFCKHYNISKFSLLAYLS